mmetsp:Transcript_11852/g.19557  ORF Transcript_11852/g.19557 Transcript_11852/m.19557 type:complete len:195 (+) Transcript_11852:186-770(+)
MNIMNIQQGPNHTTTRSTLDYSIVACFTLILLLFILLLDAYEYVAVPGASHARNQLHQGLEDLTGMEIMTKQELAQLKLEVEQAKSVVHDKKQEVEEIVEKVELMEHELKPETVPITVEEQKEEKEKEEAIVEKTVEHELGIDKWCGSCKWKNMGFSCDKRVSWLIERYHIEELEAKEASLDQGCQTRRNLRET